MTVHSVAGRGRTGATVSPSADPLLDAAVAALVKDPAASLAEVAEAAGVGRTTLHKRYATRHDLLLAIAHRSIDTVEEALAEAGAATADPAPDTFGRLVRAVLPHGAYLTFLVRAPEIYADEALSQRVDALFAPLARCVRAAAPQGLAVTSPDWWVVLCLQGQLFAAWDAVASGLLAEQAAPDLVCDWFLHGAAGATTPAAGTTFATTRSAR